MDTSFADLNPKSVEEIQMAIDKLKDMRRALLETNGGSDIDSDEDGNCQEAGIIQETSINETRCVDGVDFFDSLEMIDVTSMCFDDWTSWLTPSRCNGSINKNLTELEEDRSYMDVSLVNTQFALLHDVKAIIFENAGGICWAQPNQTNGGMMDSSTICDWKQAPGSLGSSTTSTLTTASLKSPVSVSSPLSSTNFPRVDFSSMFGEPEPLEANLAPDRHFVATPPKNIDTRTYTRPKKARTPLSGHALYSLSARKESPFLPSSMENCLNINKNLNETFVQTPNGKEVSKPRRVSRNQSYIVHKDESNDEGNSNDRTFTAHELNTTFSYAAEDAAVSPSDSTGSINNISMEELHTMARLQEQSLQNASPYRTITRKDTHVIMDTGAMRSNILKPSARTSSTDTYYVGESNPESPASSGLSSPLESQSYDDLASGDAYVGRSMPNLAITRKIPGVSSNRLSLAPAAPLQYRSHYTSDSKLAHPATNSRLSALKPVKPHSHTALNKNNGYQPSFNPSRATNRNMESNYEQQSVRQIPAPAPKAIHRSLSGMSQPRFSVPTTTAARLPPRPVSMLPTPGFSQGGRVLSRIPAPGSTRPRFSRPNNAGSSADKNPNLPDWKDGCY